MKQQSMTIEQAILLTWKTTPKIFNAINFCDVIKAKLTCTRTEGSILRVLRQLRQDNRINYVVLEHNKCIYKKTAVIKKPK